MPIRRIMINKGNSVDSITVEAESIGNRKPICTSYGYCISKSGSNWNGYNRYAYQIPCNGDWECVFKNADGTLVQATCQKNNDNSPDGFGNAEGEGCRPDYYEFFISGLNAGLNYQPKVQVLDNWGWCSGKCTEGVYGENGMPNGGCYNDNGATDCETIEVNINPWIEYGGNVVVK